MKKNQKFGKLTFLEKGSDRFVGKDRKKIETGIFRCDCGKRKEVGIYYVKYWSKKGRQVSCGCEKGNHLKERLQKLGKTRKYTGNEYKYLYTLYSRIRNRCYNKNNADYYLYGAKGVKVYKGWDTSNKFVEYILKNLGHRPSKDYSLDRIDPGGNYEPGNIRWANKYTQAQNQKLARNNSTGIRGVYLRVGRRGNATYRVKIGVNGKCKHEGTFYNIEDAIMKRNEAEKKYWEKGTHSTV